MKLEKRTEVLRSELNRLSTDKKRPTNTLWAQTQLAFMDLMLAANDHDRLSEIFGRFESILKKAEKLPEFPMETLINLVREIGHVMGELESYDRLIELILRLTGDRASRSEQGRLLVDHGYKKLSTGSVYDAISKFGRAQILLAMKEHRRTFIRALVGTGLGYEAAGLLWAARANLIVATNQLLNKFMEDGELVPQLLPLLKKLVWIELQIGRIPCVLAWIELMRAVARGLNLSQEAWESFHEEYYLMDAVLGILLLKTEYHLLRQLDGVPAILERFDLVFSRIALLFALGYEDIVSEEAELKNEDLLEFFSKWIHQPANDDLPNEPQWLLSDEVEMKSYVLGCEVIIRARNQLQSLLIAESILSILEAFLATSLDRRLMPYRSKITCELSPSEYIHSPLEFRIDEDDVGEPILKIHHSPRSITSIVKHEKFHDKMLNLVISLIANIAIPRDDNVLDELAGKERVFDRAFSLTELAIAANNIFGDTRKLHIDSWSDVKDKKYTLLRETPWQREIKTSNPEPNRRPKPLEPGKGPPPKELLGVDNFKHKDQRVFSIINKTLWDRANWKGVLYAVPHAPSLPVFALMFEVREAAEKIFRGWLKRFGDSDIQEAIRVTIVTGIDTLNPNHYRVVSMQNPDLIGEDNDENKIVVMLLRKNTMMPAESRNLDLFLEALRQSQEYLLAPALLSGSSDPEIGFGLAIRKKEIKILPAWQIDVNSPEIMALSNEDRPFVPADVSDPPIRRAMEWLSKLN